MKTLCLLLIFLLGLITASGIVNGDDEKAIISQLQNGGRILLIRHALAPGSGDPDTFKIGDCSTQRNLNEKGRSQAKQIGQWLRGQGIVDARVYSSQWCRCLETARLLNLGAVTELSVLNSFFNRPNDREPNLAALQAFFSQQPADGRLIIMVTHYVTIAAMTGKGVSSGEGVVLGLNGDGSYTVSGRLGLGL